MSEFFTYAFMNGGRRVHVHFVPPEQAHTLQVVEGYVDFQKAHGSPDELVFLGFEFRRNVVSAVLEGDDLKARSPALMPLRGGSIRGLLFHASGKIIDMATNAPITGILQHELRKHGMLSIFKARSGMVETSSSFHYIKPSGQHVERFVRTSNTLVSGAEVNFMAAWISPLLTEDVRVVHCDTSGISAIAHAAIALRCQFEAKTRAIAVDSFGSYAGLKRNSLRDTSSCVALISASTSGNMARKITDGGVPHSSVITIYYLSSEKPAHPVLCNLADGGLASVTNHSEADCPLCARGSIALRMEGDVFMPEPPKTTSHVIRAADAPAKLADFVDDILGCRAVRCAVRRPSSSEYDEVYVDAARLLKGAREFREHWRRLLTRSVPLHLAQIVHFDDENSRKLATHAQRFITRNGGSKAKRIAVGSRLPATSERLSNPNGSTLVISASLVRGRKLTAVARALRDSQQPVIYLIGVARMTTKAALDETKENVTYSSNGVRHVCDWAAEMHLPPARPEKHSSWATELALLQQWISDGETEPAVVKRHDLLAAGRDADGREGFLDFVYWPDVGQRPLALRDGFALFPKEYNASIVTAADVYLAVSAVLHELRFGDPRKARLVQGPRHHALLSPRNFDRFNDGIIQAALLRAAMPVELDYSLSREDSSYMQELLLSIFRNAGEPQGEAAPEFAIAVLTGRVKLNSTDYNDMRAVLLRDRKKLAPMLRTLIEHLPEDPPT